MNDSKHYEIDLVKLFKDFFIYVKKNKIIVLAFTTLGFAYGFYVYKSNPNNAKPVFEKIVLLKSKTVPNEVMQDVVNSLQLILKEQRTEELEEIALKMGLTKKIVSEFKNVKPKAAESGGGDNFRIALEVYNKNYMNDFANGLVKFLNANEFIKSNQDVVNAQKKQLIQTIDEQLKSLDSSNLGKNDVNTIRSYNSKYYSYVDLLEGKQKAEKELLLDNEIKLIDISYPVREKSTFINYFIIVVFSIFGFIISLVVAKFFEKKK